MRQTVAGKTPRESNSSHIAIDLAILAMSHRQLGNQTEATEFREQLNELMKQDAFKDDKDCQAFLAEVNELFESNSEKEK